MSLVGNCYVAWLLLVIVFTSFDKFRLHQFCFPKIAAEWHPNLNLPTLASEVTPKSGQKFWWQCPKGHSYDASVANRTNGRNCPFCSGRRVGEDNNLSYLFPELAKEWHPQKNGNLSPEEMSPGSHKKVWWQCNKNHSYFATINKRTSSRGTGCPYCAGKKADSRNNLEYRFPKIAAQWHPRKNGTHLLYQNVAI